MNNDATRTQGGISRQVCAQLVTLVQTLSILFASVDSAIVVEVKTTSSLDESAFLTLISSLTLLVIGIATSLIWITSSYSSSNDEYPSDDELFDDSDLRFS